jgi:hypothetical protein
MIMPARENNWLSGLDRWLTLQPFTWYVNLHGDLWQKSGLPDRLILSHGVLFAVEAKQEGKKPGMLQQWTLTKIEGAGGVVIRKATNKDTVVFGILEALKARGLLPTMEYKK